MDTSTSIYFNIYDFSFLFLKSFQQCLAMPDPEKVFSFPSTALKVDAGVFESIKKTVVACFAS